MGIKLLCVGDIHLGRRPARLTEELLEVVEASELTPGRAWRRTVDTAIRREVDGVLLAGDTVDDEHDFFEAYSHLAEGVERLLAAGIPVLAVAGNHDVQVLPRLADAIPDFRLVGRGGTWESVPLRGRDGSQALLMGWSFPTREVHSSPLASLPALPRRSDGGLPVIGLLHCDRDGSSSRYAPVRARELQDAGFDAFLLGHIHRPDPFKDGGRIGYLGSLSGLNPTETGAHGPCLLEIEPNGPVRIERIPLAPLRWERIELDVGELREAGELGGQITARIEALHQELRGAELRPRAVGLRIRLIGRTALRRDLEQWLRREQPRNLVIVRDDVAYFVQRVCPELRPAVDLVELARGGADPAALLARKLLALERPGDADRAELIGRARARFGRVVQGQWYGALDRSAPDDDQTAELLRRAALTALDELLLQRETAS